MADSLPPSLQGEVPSDDDHLLRAFARCSDCLGAHLLASDHPGRTVHCPKCDTRWYVEPEALPRHLDLEGDMEALARWLPVLFGRAVNYDAQGGGTPLHGQRNDHIDAHHRDRRGGLRVALQTLARLEALVAAEQDRHARVLWFAFGQCGPELVLRHKGGRADLVAEHFATKEQKARWESRKSRVLRGVGPARYGQELLRGAVAAYVSAVRGTLRPTPSAPPTPATLSQLLARAKVDLAALRRFAHP